MKYQIHKEAFKILKNYYDPGQFSLGRQKMTKMPSNAKLIYNPTSGAPGFIVENVFCLPGVPSILKSMLGDLQNKILGGKKMSSVSPKAKTGLDNPLTAWYSMLVGWLRTKTDDL